MLIMSKPQDLNQHRMSKWKNLLIQQTLGPQPTDSL